VVNATPSALHIKFSFTGGCRWSESLCRTLALGDRDERGIWKSLAHELNVWQVEAAMQGGEKRYPQAPKEWQVHPIQMRMDHIESRRGVCYCFE
jgi:hypothetical protein